MIESIETVCTGPSDEAISNTKLKSLAWAVTHGDYLRSRQNLAEAWLLRDMGVVAWTRPMRRKYRTQRASVPVAQS